MVTVVTAQKKETDKKRRNPVTGQHTDYTAALHNHFQLQKQTQTISSHVRIISSSSSSSWDRSLVLKPRSSFNAVFVGYVFGLFFAL